MTRGPSAGISDLRPSARRDLAADGTGRGAAAPGAPTRRLPAALAALAAVSVVYLALPFVFGFAALDRTAIAETARDAAAAGAVRVSLLTATVSTAIAAAFGIPLAYVLARARFRGRGIVNALVYLPLVVPPLAGGVLLLTLYGPYGLLGRWFDRHGIQLVDAWPGIVLAQVFVAAPFLIVAAKVAFDGVDVTLERTSYALGVAPLPTFLRVALPLAWPGILAGLPLTWLRALGEFGATMMVAYHPYSLPVYLFVQFGAQGLRAALPLAAVLVALGALALLAAYAVSRRRPEAGTLW